MKIALGSTFLGPDEPALIVAELSANHCGKYELAVETIKAAKAAGADAVKIQTYTAETLTIDCDNECFRITGGTLWDGKTLHELYREAYTPWEWHAGLKAVAEENGLIFFSTPFDATAVDFLQALGVAAFKIASFEITDLDLIETVAAKGKPVIISTGIATLDEIEAAVATCRNAGNDRIILLKCTSSYPAPLAEANLRTIPDMAERFGVLAGLSDHSHGITAPVAAVALGAKVVEKHFILDRNLGGPDAAFSLEPAEFAAMVEAVRGAEKSLGAVTYELSERVAGNRIFARSLFVVRDIRAGEAFSRENVRSIRPGHGLPPKLLKSVIGRKAASDIIRGTPLSWDLVK